MEEKISRLEWEQIYMGNFEQYPDEVKGYIDQLSQYVEVNYLDEINILHMYPGNIAYPNGYYDSRFFDLVGFNLDLNKKVNYGRRDGLMFGKGVEPQIMRIFIDGSTLIRFKQPVRIIGGQAAIVDLVDPSQEFYTV